MEKRKKIKFIVSLIVFAIAIVLILNRVKVTFASSGPTEQYQVTSVSNYNGVSREITLKEISLTSIPAIFQFGLYDSSTSGSSNTFCTYYPTPEPSVSTAEEQNGTSTTSEPNYYNVNPGNCN